VKKRLLSDTALAAGILVVLLGITVASVPLSSDKEPPPPLSSHSTRENGSRALYVWLEELGYQVSNSPGKMFKIPAETAAVFLLAPDSKTPLRQTEWAELDNFVLNGGILVAAGDSDESSSVADHYGFSVMRDGYNHYILPFTPVLRSPPLDFGKVNQMTFNYLDRSIFDYSPILVMNIHPYAVSLPRGKGQVILVADSTLFTNLGLKHSGVPELLLNILTPIPRGTKIWFDEWHHGERPAAAAPPSTVQERAKTVVNQALLWVLIVVVAGLALEGRYFGRPLAAEKTATRRGPLEHVNALANLNQRAGHRGEILSGYYRQVKRGLSRRYRIDPDLTDGDTARILSETQPEIDAAAFLDLLTRLKHPSPTEQEMVELAHLAVETLQKIEQSSAGSRRLTSD
jgi:hypothetical protein